MAEGLGKRQRTIIAQQAALFTFDGDVAKFIETGEMRKRQPIPTTPEVEQKIAEIHASGGKLIID